MRFLFDVVVVAVNQFSDRLDMRPDVFKRLDDIVDHRAAIGARIVLSPLHSLHVAVKRLFSFLEVRKRTVDKFNAFGYRERLCFLDKTRSHDIARAA